MGVPHLVSLVLEIPRSVCVFNCVPDFACLHPKIGKKASNILHGFLLLFFIFIFFNQNSLERISMLSSAMPLQCWVDLHHTALLGKTAVSSGCHLAQEWPAILILCGTEKGFLRL